MYINRYFGLLVALFIGFSLTTTAFAETDTQTVKKEEVPKVTSKIFLLIIDGLQADTLQKTSAPNINGISNSGVKATEVVSVFPDTAQATLASILTGLLPEKHQFIQPGDTPKGNTLQELMVDKKINTAFFGAEGEMKKLLAKEGYNCKGPFNDKDEQVMDNVLNEWSQSQSYLNVIVLPELRSVVNKYGAKSVDYKMAVTKTDAQVGRLLKKLHEEKIFDNSMIIITGTFGAPPLVMKGLPFKESTQIPPVSICDIAPTIGYLNGIEYGKTDGMVLWNSFNETAGQNNEYLLSERVKDLSLSNSRLLQEMFRLQEEKLEVKRQQEIVAREKEDIQRQIKVRDNKIDLLKNKINLYHMVALVVLLILVLGYFVLYKLLKKRFLMF